MKIKLKFAEGAKYKSRLIELQSIPRVGEDIVLDKCACFDVKRVYHVTDQSKEFCAVLEVGYARKLGVPDEFGLLLDRGLVKDKRGKYVSIDE